MKHPYTVLLMGAALVFAMAGCGEKAIPAADPAPTLAPTSTPAPTLTPTPLPSPTPTPAPRIVGRKTAGAKSIYINNHTDKQFRQLYLQTAGSGDWGQNLLQPESSIRAAERFQMYYTPQPEEGVSYNMRLVDSAGMTYEIYSVELSDMESASLKIDQETGAAYLTYMSIASKNEKNTKNNSYAGYGGYEGSDSGGLDESQEWEVYYYDNGNNGADTGEGSDSSSSSQSTGTEGGTGEGGSTGADTGAETGGTGGDTGAGDNSGTGGETGAETGGDGSGAGAGDGAIIYYDDSSSSDDSDMGDMIIWDENGDWS